MLARPSDADDAPNQINYTAAFSRHQLDGSRLTAGLVSLVIPGRNCARTIRPCLEAVTAIASRPQAPLAELILVDDGSTDETPSIVAPFPVVCLRIPPGGPGAARNAGWRAAKQPLIWFLDADCVAEPDALDRLLPFMDDPRVAGVGGSYGNMAPDSLLSCLIHEEIIERHLAMPSSVDFLATFNVLYRRAVLEQLDGFDERYQKAQDAELAFRVIEAGFELRFERSSRVRHYHPTRWRSYLRTQRQQGYWRVWLHAERRGRSTSNSYSNLIDHAQPPLAVLGLVSVPLFWLPPLRWAPVVALGLLLAAQAPMTVRLLRRLRDVRYLAYAPLGFIRAFWRGLGMLQGGIAFAMPSRGKDRSDGR